MQHTTYLNLNKPEIAVDRANIDMLNANMDILDTAVHGLEISEGDKQDKLTAGANIQINASNVISATDTTYSDFIGTDGITAGTAGLVPAPAVTDTNKALFSDGTWKSVSTSAPVTDVEVDGTSVVNSSGVANIDLTGKQDTLTAGTNITIDSNNVISATGNTDYTELTQDEYDLLTPAEKENGTLYFITDASGDPQVVPNPQGTPTDTLNTIGINNTIYDIAGSGGSSHTIVDVLWSGTETPSAGTPYTATLSKAITEYDLIVIDAYENNDGGQMQLSLPVSTIVYGEYYSDYYYNTANYVKFTDATHVDLIMFASANLTVYTKITGIKFCGTLAPMIYSFEEREVGVWSDDKPLYQKSFDKRSLYLADNTWSNSILGTTGIHIVNYEGYFCLGAGVEPTIPYSYYRSSTEFFTSTIDTSYSDINVRPNMNYGAIYAGIVTIWYTKNSDVAGSGSYGSLGVSMEHYDNTERVIGTYFGETLYQKTIPNNSITGTTTTIQTGVNIGTLVAVEATGYKIDGSSNIIRFKESYNDGGDRLDVEGINDDIRVICSSWFDGSTIDITIKYTKSST